MHWRLEKEEGLVHAFWRLANWLPFDVGIPYRPVVVLDIVALHSYQYEVCMKFGATLFLCVVVVHNYEPGASFQRQLIPTHLESRRPGKVERYKYSLEPLVQRSLT